MHGRRLRFRQSLAVPSLHLHTNLKASYVWRSRVIVNLIHQSSSLDRHASMAPPPDLDLDEIYAFALELGSQAGAMLDDAWRSRCSEGRQEDQLDKDSAVDIVTQTDIGEWMVRVDP